MIEPIYSDQKPPVAIKGTKEGLLFILDESVEQQVLVEHLQNLFHGDTSSLFNGPEVGISIDYGVRKMSRAESREILDIFLQKDNFILLEWSSETMARRSLYVNRTKSSGQSIFKGTVRAGQNLFYDGDVVVIGDVNPGGEISATGDVYVFGRLRGTAHAGARGNEACIIAATEFSPMQLRIAGTVSRAPEVDGKPLNTFMEFAYLRDNNMAVDKIQFLSAHRKEMQ